MGSACGTGAPSGLWSGTGSRESGVGRTSPGLTRDRDSIKKGLESPAGFEALHFFAFCLLPSAFCLPPPPYFFFDDFFFPAFFFGTLPPAFRASDNPIAIACFLLVTFLPERLHS